MKLSNSSRTIDQFSELVFFDQNIFKENKNNNVKLTLLIGLDEVGRGCIAGPVTTAAYSCLDFYYQAEDLVRFLNYSTEFLDENIFSLLALNDSKKVPHHLRETLCEVLLDLPSLNESKHIFHAVAFEPAANIDQKGIVECIWDAMSQTISDLIEQFRSFYNQKPQEIILLVDGPKKISNLETRLKILNPDSNFYETDYLPNQATMLTEIIAENTIILRQFSTIEGDSKSASIAAASNLAKSARDNYMRSLKTLARKYNWTTNVGYGTKDHYKAIEAYGLSKQHRKSFIELN